MYEDPIILSNWTQNNCYSQQISKQRFNGGKSEVAGYRNIRRIISSELYRRGKRKRGSFEQRKWSVLSNELSERRKRERKKERQQRGKKRRRIRRRVLPLPPRSSEAIRDFYWPGRSSSVCFSQVLRRSPLGWPGDRSNDFAENEWTDGEEFPARETRRKCKRAIDSFQPVTGE